MISSNGAILMQLLAFLYISIQINWKMHENLINHLSSSWWVDWKSSRISFLPIIYKNQSCNCDAMNNMPLLLLMMLHKSFYSCISRSESLISLLQTTWPIICVWVRYIRVMDKNCPLVCIALEGRKGIDDVLIAPYELLFDKWACLRVCASIPLPIVCATCKKIIACI